MAEPSDDTAHLIDHLRGLGLTRYEALVYIGLLYRDGATATEIHELSGVPRASVYPVIEKLIGRKMVDIAHTSPRRYRAVPPGEAVANLMAAIEDQADSARAEMEDIYSRRNQSSDVKQELIWTVYGSENIISKVREIIPSIEEKVEVFATKTFIAIPGVKKLLKAVGEREDISLDIITERWDGEIARNMHIGLFDIGEEDKNPAIQGFIAGICIVDRRYVIMVMGTSEEDVTALISGSPGFIEFFSRYWNFINHEVATRLS
ncbi:DNA-binding MarR family transcriptional regulator [Methanocalculus alkaliphilus]|uniref:TrmB family transcriptional regulator n=1 Tax=Methanocalculus alkaliphilus TaxID=768730 RepID=UPI00209F5240|nr:helix-turn-helix domain-containing protein [Methanocalculus alkaliphilus]MCP1716253.1 DNA-binding MarR family transcriptional regulator [Methanocalculus alkaliphilus]